MTSLACSVKFPNEKNSRCVAEFENYKLCLKDEVSASRQLTRRRD